MKMSLLAESTREKQQGYFRREILPALKDFPIESVSRANISAITLKIQQSGREVATTHESDSQSFIEALQEVAERVKERQA